MFMVNGRRTFDNERRPGSIALSQSLCCGNMIVNLTADTTELARSCWFLTGATASGKTRVGLELAERLGAEIISLDSMAIYRGMDVGTAKPTAEDRGRVPHHLLDLVDPTEEFSVSQYVALAHKKIR